MQGRWRNVSWAGVMALAGGLVVMILAIAGDITPLRSAKLAGLGAIIAAVGGRWIGQSLRDARVARCAHCTIRFDGRRPSVSCQTCGAQVHAGCLEGHADVYHPRPEAYR